MRKLAKLAALVALLAPSLAAAQLSLGARLGYGFATGKIADEEDADLKDFIAYQIPLRVEAGWRVVPDLTIGAYFSAGIGGPGDAFEDACDASGVDCSFRVLRLGAQALYTFSTVSPSVVPWVGVGTGWEWASLDVESDLGDAEVKSNGWEVVNLQAGADFKVGSGFFVGPFVEYATGRYGEGEAEGVTSDIENKAFHGWLQIGVRGRFDL